MRRTLIVLAAALALSAACGSGVPAATSGPVSAGSGGTPGAGTTPGSGTTPAAVTTPGAVTTPAAPTAAGAGGAGTVQVVLTGGPNAGTYSATGETRCSNGLVGPQAWGVQFSTDTATAGQLSSVQMVVAAAGKESDPNATFPGTGFLMTVTIGPLFGGTNFEVAVNTDATKSKGSGSATVQDNGSTATIQATGTTLDGVGIQATVNCDTVIRM